VHAVGADAAIWLERSNARTGEIYMLRRGSTRRSGSPSAGRGLVGVWTPGARHFAVRSLMLPARTSGSDTFIVW
jgi:hypothetical protein